MNIIQLPTHADILILEWAIATNNTAVIESYRPMVEVCNDYLNKLGQYLEKSGILELYEKSKESGNNQPY